MDGVSLRVRSQEGTQGYRMMIVMNGAVSQIHNAIDIPVANAILGTLAHVEFQNND